LHAEWIEYLKRENKSNFDLIKNYYMPRKLRRFIQIDRRILEQNKDDDFIIVHSEEEFNEKCRQKHRMKNIHYLIDSQCLLWQKSSGPISKLNKYLIKNGEGESIDEEEIFRKNNEKILIISAEPGMGKSLILDNFTQNSSAENFFIKIVLNTCKVTLSDKSFMEKLKMSKDLIEFVVKSLLNKNNEQEISLLKLLAQEEKLTLMFDGLDEISDYLEQVIQLIETLNNNCRIQKIVITTRNHLREELEDHFKTFSFSLNNFDDDDQKNFLYKYWRSLNSCQEMSDKKLMKSAASLLRQLKISLTKNICELIGIPLQTKILADIYSEQIKNNELKVSNVNLNNIVELYRHFIQMKIKILYKEKNNLIIEQLSKQFRTLFEKSEKNFYSDHIKLSSSILFDNKDENRLDLELTEEEILEYGVIVAFTNRIPTFLHQSFAEFFLAKSSFQKIEQNKDDEYDKELEEILRDERHFLIRRFLNDLMTRREYPSNQITNKKDFKEEITNCCRENLISLLKYLIQQKGANLKIKNEFLTIASQNDHKEIVVYLLEKGIDANQPSFWNETALQAASELGHKEISEILLEQNNINVNQQDDYGYTALIWACNRGHKEIAEILLANEKINVNQQEEDGFTALMWASKYGHKEVVEILLQVEKINVNQKNKDRDSALTLTTSEGHKEIVELLLQNENIKINQKNKDGNSALILSSSNGNKEIVQMLLKHANINVNQHGHTALTRASQEGHLEIVEFLEEKIKKKNLEKEEEHITTTMKTLRL
jgi:ankyrin repeat protein